MPDDHIVPFSSEDEQMEAAISEAKANFKQFLDAFLNPTGQQRSFLLKVVFDEGASLYFCGIGRGETAL